MTRRMMELEQDLAVARDAILDGLRYMVKLTTELAQLAQHSAYGDDNALAQLRDARRQAGSAGESEVAEVARRLSRAIGSIDNAPIRTALPGSGDVVTNEFIRVASQVEELDDDLIADVVYPDVVKIDRAIARGNVRERRSRATRIARKSRTR